MPGRESYGPAGKWVHDRAHKIMDKRKSDLIDRYGEKKGKSIAYAIATQQAHKVRKSPKKHRTKAGFKKAIRKHDKPLKEYRKTAAIDRTPKDADSLSQADVDKLLKRFSNSDIGQGYEDPVMVLFDSPHAKRLMAQSKYLNPDLADDLAVDEDPAVRETMLKRPDVPTAIKVRGFNYERDRAVGMKASKPAQLAALGGAALGGTAGALLGRKIGLPVAGGLMGGGFGFFGAGIPVYDWAREKAEKGMPTQPLPEKYKTAGLYDILGKLDPKSTPLRPELTRPPTANQKLWRSLSSEQKKRVVELERAELAKKHPKLSSDELKWDHHKGYISLPLKDRMALMKRVKTAGLLRPDQPRAKDVIKGRGPEKRKARAALRDKLREGCPMQKEALSADLIRRALSKATGRKADLTKQYGDLIYRSLGKKEISPKIWKSVEPDLVREGSKALRQTEGFSRALAKKGSVDQIKLAAFFDELEKIKQAGLLRMLKPIKAAKPVKSIGQIAAESVGQHRALKAAKPRLVARVKSQYGSARKAA